MATSSYSSTEETTNSNRACRLLLGPCTDELRDVLRHHVPPSTFPHAIVREDVNLPRLTAPQIKLILPRNSSYAGNYNDMDISLLYILLRNICNIPAHNNGWGNDPDPTDRSLSANIERIRLARNQCVHSSSQTLSNADFNTIWSTVRSAVVDLDSFLNNRNQYEREVDFLRHETMDPVRDRHYIEELRRQTEEDTANREMIHGLKRKLEQSDTDRIQNQNKMQKIVDEIANSAVPPNVKAIHRDDVLKWKEHDKVFYESHNFPAMLEKIKKQPLLMCVGVPGSGKTSTVRHIALKLQQQEGYNIVPIKDIKKIKDYCDPRNPQVFVIDDVVGVFGLQETKLNLLYDYQDEIIKPILSKSKTLMTCREAVYRKTLQSTSLFTDEKNIVLLHSEVNALNNRDKKEIMKKYNIDENLLSPASLTSASKMFPYLCKMYSTEKKFQLYGPDFFENPVPCILKELDEMQKQNKIHYASLVLCMMNENKISKKMLKEKEKERVIKNFNEMKNKVLEKFDISSKPLQFVNALSEMKGTYTKLCGTEYSFFHDSMFEIVAYHFGCQFQKLILQFMSSSYISNYVKLQKCKKQEAVNENKQASMIVASTSESKEEKENVAVNDESCDEMESFDLCIRLKEEQIPMLAERLYRDIENMELYDVFMNNVLKHPKVYLAFINVLKREPYIELKSLFLSKLKDGSKVGSKRESVWREIKEKDKRRREWRRQRLLVDESCVMVISWLVYYGHNQILQYILEQSELHTDPQSELFKNRFYSALSYISKRKSVFWNFLNGYPSDDREISLHSLLVLSCYTGDVEILKILLKYANTNTINRKRRYCGYRYMWNDTPLIAACDGGHTQVVEQLLQAGAHVNLQGHFNTPLTAASKAGHTIVVKKLIQNGADVNLPGKYHTPLTAARRGGHMGVVKALEDAGAVELQGKYDTQPTAATRGENRSVVNDPQDTWAKITTLNSFESIPRIKKKFKYLRTSLMH